MLAVAPAAAVVAGLAFTLTAGVTAMAAHIVLELVLHPGADHRAAQVAFLATAGVTIAAVLASRARTRREHELARARCVAEAVQQVLLQPVPRRAGPVGLAVRYLSGARVGGDLCEVAATSRGVRLVVGDVQGKGLPAVQQAAAVLGVFWEAAWDEDCLAGVAVRIEASLARQFDDEQFVTAILAEVAADGLRVHAPRAFDAVEISGTTARRDLDIELGRYAGGKVARRTLSRPVPAGKALRITPTDWDRLSRTKIEQVLE